MKTIGEILRTARLERHLSLQDISAATKIEEKYLSALEKNDFASLPPSTFVKGFIRNYALAVGKSPEDLLAIFRRDYGKSAPKPAPAPARKDSRRSFPSFTRIDSSLPVPPHTLALIFLGAAIFIGYLLFQYRAFLSPPPLEIIAPKDKAVVTSPVAIEGKTSADSIITVNQEIDVNPNQSGVFFTQLPFSPGEHQLEIVSVNRFGRRASVTLTVTVLSQD